MLAELLYRGRAKYLPTQTSTLDVQETDAKFKEKHVDPMLELTQILPYLRVNFKVCFPPPYDHKKGKGWEGRCRSLLLVGRKDMIIQY